MNSNQQSAHPGSGRLTESDRISVLLKHKEGQNISEIAKETKHDRKTIRKWIQRWETEENVKDKQRPGAKRKLTIAQESAFLAAAEADCNLDLADYIRKKSLIAPSRR